MKRTPYVLRGLCVLVALGPALGALADLVKLKDGTVLDGTILSEDDKQIVIEVEYASGSITKEETVGKSEIVEIKRLTTEEKAERQMQRDFEITRKYQLDPSASFPLAKYDQIINTVFRRFLSQYTNSPYEKEIKGKIAQWEAERDKVDTGHAKYRGRWMPAGEATKLAEQERTRRLLQQGRTQLAKGRYDEAIKQFQIVSRTGLNPETVEEAKDLETKAYRQWLTSVERDQQRLTAEIQAAEESAERARKAKAKAEGNAGRSGAGEVRRMGVDAFKFEAARAENDVKQAERQAAELRKQSESLQKLSAELSAHVPGAAVPSPVASAAAVSRATPTGTAESSSPAQAAAQEDSASAWLGTMAQWVKEKWYFVAGGVIILIWVLSKAMDR